MRAPASLSATIKQAGKPYRELKENVYYLLWKVKIKIIKFLDYIFEFILRSRKNSIQPKVPFAPVKRKVNNEKGR